MKWVSLENFLTKTYYTRISFFSFLNISILVFVPHKYVTVRIAAPPIEHDVLPPQ